MFASLFPTLSLTIVLFFIYYTLQTYWFREQIVLRIKILKKKNTVVPQLTSSLGDYLIKIPAFWLTHLASEFQSDITKLFWPLTLQGRPQLTCSADGFS